MDNEHEVTIYSSGLIALSACAEDSLTGEEVAERVNTLQPTGIGSSWEISQDEAFRTGELNPHPCETVGGRQHWLLSC